MVCLRGLARPDRTQEAGLQWRRATGGQAEEGEEAVSAGEITGIARIIARNQTLEGIRYRIRIVETSGRRRPVDGTIEAAPGIISALHDAGESVIELGSVLGWFGFVVPDAHRGEIKLTGWIDGRALSG